MACSDCHVGVGCRGSGEGGGAGEWEEGRGGRMGGGGRGNKFDRSRLNSFSNSVRCPLIKGSLISKRSDRRAFGDVSAATLQEENV